MDEQAMCAKRFSVVRGDHNQRVIGKVSLLQFCEKPANLVVNISNGSVVSVDFALQLVGRGG